MGILVEYQPERGKNIFVEAARRQELTDKQHKQPKPRLCLRHRPELVIERETPIGTITANARILLNGAAHAVHLMRERLDQVRPSHGAELPLGELAVHDIAAVTVPSDEAAV